MVHESLYEPSFEIVELCRKTQEFNTKLVVFALTGELKFDFLNILSLPLLVTTMFGMCLMRVCNGVSYVCTYVCAACMLVCV